MALAATMHQMELAKRTVNLSGGGGGSSSADQISYNNTTSGMIATNVQGAIDENATKIDDLSNKIGEDEIEVGDNVIDGLNTLNENLSQVENKLKLSTKEHIVGTYCGKPLYSKTVTKVMNIPINSQQDINFSSEFPNANEMEDFFIDSTHSYLLDVISGRKQMRPVNCGASYAIPFIPNTGTYENQMYICIGNATFASYSLSASSVTITLQYTKKAD